MFFYTFTHLDSNELVGIGTIKQEFWSSPTGKQLNTAEHICSNKMVFSNVLKFDRKQRSCFKIHLH